MTASHHRPTAEATGRNQKNIQNERGEKMSACLEMDTAAKADRMSVKEAAELLGMSVEAVHQRMQKGYLQEIGRAVKGKGGHYQYLIYRDRVMQFIGKKPAGVDVDELAEKVAERVVQMLVDGLGKGVARNAAQ